VPSRSKASLAKPGRRLGAAVLVASALLPVADSAAQSSLAGQLGRVMRQAGSYSGAYVANADSGRPVFGFRADTPRILASNTKLFTTAAALARFGVEGTLGTEVRGIGTPEPGGVWRGDLYLRGGGDPTFGSRRFVSRSYGGGATVELLAARVEAAGIQRITGRIQGDESRFDSLRGGPDSRYGVSSYVGPLSALVYNRGLATERGRGFQSNPPLFAAAHLDGALKRRGLRVGGRPGVRRTPPEAETIASVESPPMSRLVRITNKPSDNFFAEMLLKALAMQANGKGTTGGGAGLAAGFARRLGAGPRLADGSGLSRSNRASPRRVVRLLLAIRRRNEYPALFESLPVAGRDGTLRDRMRRGPARGRCRGKTGTIAGVSTLSGYCRARSGASYAFSFLMNGVNTVSARRLQDRMAHAIAASG
jgi:D-alanyl-D-alanine carboxypeptidase/D-alanyl-D-alanine-endopeptidase (penicillin-binding protein 4)